MRVPGCALRLCIVADLGGTLRPTDEVFGFRDEGLGLGSAVIRRSVALNASCCVTCCGLTVAGQLTHSPRPRCRPSQVAKAFLLEFRT